MGRSGRMDSRKLSRSGIIAGRPERKEERDDPNHSRSGSERSMRILLDGCGAVQRWEVTVSESSGAKTQGSDAE